MQLDSRADLRFALWNVELLRNSELEDIIADRCESLKVSFYEHGQANDFEMTLDNSLKEFSDPDIFQLGDEVKFHVYFADRPWIFMGKFTIDDITDEAPPSVVRVSGLASNTVAENLRTLKTRGFEKQSLFTIVRNIAREHKLNPVIKGEDVKLDRLEQKEEHDLRFVTRLAEKYGFIFRIEGDDLHFVKREIEEKKDVYSLKGLLGRRTFKYKTFKTYKKIKVRYYDPQKKEYRETEVEDPAIKNDECLKCTERCESLEQAKTIAKARLKDANKRKVEGELECLGVPELKAGINVLVENEGALFDGEWHIEEAHHTYSKAEGYKVSLKGYKLDGGKPEESA